MFPVDNKTDEWKQTVDLLVDLRADEKNIVKVLHDDNDEVVAIFIQMEKQHRLYQKYGTILQLDGTYKTTKAGFSLYHLLIEDNNGDSQPVALFFLKEETMEAISECLKLFSQLNINIFI